MASPTRSLGKSIDPGLGVLYRYRYSRVSMPGTHNFTNSVLGYTPIHPAFSCAVEVPGTLKLTHCMSVIRQWIQECDAQHTVCLSTVSPTLPGRLLDVSEDFPRLIETTSMSYCRYATLSHCWGDASHMIKTTKDTYERKRTRIYWEELPQLFKDAISIAQGVDCKLIWIDSLCIIVSPL